MSNDPKLEEDVRTALLALRASDDEVYKARREAQDARREAQDARRAAVVARRLAESASRRLQQAQGELEEARLGVRVYFVQGESGGPVKIGSTVNVEARLQWRA